MTVNRSPIDHIKTSQLEARRASKSLTEASGQTFVVTAVIVRVGATSVPFGKKSPNVAVGSSNRLVGWLRLQPTVLPPSMVTMLVTHRGEAEDVALEVGGSL